MPEQDNKARQSFEKEALPFLQEIFASALRLTRQKETAEDLVSEVYTRAWKSYGDRQFTPGTNMRAWLYRILTNTFINHYRRDKRRPVILDLDRPEGQDEEGPSLYERLSDTHRIPGENPEKVLSRHILDSHLKKAIESLPEDFRIIVLLADVQGFSYQDIADMLTIPIGTVRSRLWRGRRLLQHSLWNEAVEAGVIDNASEQERTQHD
jgi:RNA polymerase sigma-70 factor (ECF subfamily)